MMHWFFEWGWLYLMIGMSVVLTVQLCCHWKDWSAVRKLGAFTVIVLTFHVWEEWVIPGGFHYYYNIASAPALRDRYPMNLITDMITNFGGAVLWFLLVELDRYGRKMSFAVTIFSFAEVAIHLLGAASSRQTILDAGQYSPMYGPGMLTALLCWLPLGIAYLVFFAKTGLHLKEAVSGMVILALLSVLLINIPESLLKDENTSWRYANAGWYEQFIDET